MNAFFWLVFEMLPLLLLTAIVFLTTGWRWHASQRLIEQTHAEPVSAPVPQVESIDLQDLRSQLDESKNRERELAGELARLRDTSSPSTPPEPEPVTVDESASEPDDLTRIRGIGRVLAARLAEAGVTRCHQLAELSEDEVDALDQRLNLRGRARRDAWRDQAQQLNT
jgi:predicted flap endonuclease-1-like 5' DNA nuclease